MAEYIDKQAAANIFSRARAAMKPQDYHTFDEMNTRDLMLLNAEQAIRAIPAADVIEPVRCKDCRYSYEEPYSMGISHRVCAYGVYVDCEVEDDFYCANGVKTDESEFANDINVGDKGESEEKDDV